MLAFDEGGDSLHIGRFLREQADTSNVGKSVCCLSFFESLSLKKRTNRHIVFILGILSLLFFSNLMLYYVTKYVVFIFKFDVFDNTVLVYIVKVLF